MGSATAQALAASTKALAAAKDVTIDTARELFAAARAVGDSSQLSGALADPAAAVDARQKVVSAVFAGLSDTSRGVLGAAVAERWSNADELVDGIEELAIRSAAIAEPAADIEGELFGFSRVIAANPELELALGSRLGGSDAKGALVEKLLAGTTTSAPSALIVSSLVRQPRERRVRQLLSRAIRIVSSQRGLVVATVHTATELSEAQRTRLSDALSRRYDGEVSLNVVIDPAVVGGLRVQIADDVIDGSISARLADLRQKLAG
jgi:F-type H+-transporting ATPase subunit delta